MKIFTHREVRSDDLIFICEFSQNEDEFIFVFPKPSSMTVDQLRSTIENCSDSTVVLSGEVVVGFANFYEVQKDHHCLIGNIIVNPLYRGKGVGGI